MKAAAESGPYRRGEHNHTGERAMRRNAGLSLVMTLIGVSAMAAPAAALLVSELRLALAVERSQPRRVYQTATSQDARQALTNHWRLLQAWLIVGYRLPYQSPS